MKSKCHLSTVLIVLLYFFPGCTGKSTSSAQLQDSGGGICLDTVSGLMWQIEESSILATFDEAQRYARDLTLGGYGDWRLPTRQELNGLRYLFDLHLAGQCAVRHNGNYWSMERDGQGMAGAWEITANQCDPAREYVHGQQGRVRAVRP